jgi:hypothetical protein
VNNIVVRFVLVCAGCGFASGAPAATFYAGSWSIDTLMSNVFDSRGGQTLAPLTSAISEDRSVSGVFFLPPAKANGSVKISGGAGQLKVYSSADLAIDPGNLAVTGGAVSTAFVSLSDTMHLITPVSNHAVKLTAYWRIAGLASVDGVGERSVGNTPASLLSEGAGTLDYVDVAATASLQLTGSGLPAPLYTNNGDAVANEWGYAADIIDSRNTLDIHIVRAAPEFVEVNLVFPFGTTSMPFNFTVTANTSARVSVWDPNRGGSANAFVNFEHTFSWGGVTSVTDAVTGAPITDWTLTSDSGFDYSHPAAPEPSSLMLAAIAVVVTLLRRRPTSHNRV